LNFFYKGIGLREGLAPTPVRYRHDGRPDHGSELQCG